MALLIVPRESWNHPTSASSSSQTAQSSNQPQSSTSLATSSATSSDFGALAELVDPSLRRKVAKDVNEAILQSQGERREANIRYLVRARTWAEQLAREKKMDLPERLSLGLDGDEDEAEVSGSGSGGGERNGRESGRNGHDGGGDTDMGEDGEESGAGAGAPDIGRRSTRRGGNGGDGGSGSGSAAAEGVMAQYTNVPS